MAMIRPTLILELDIDESALSEDMVAYVKRSYAHVAACDVLAHPSSTDPEHIVRFNIKLNKPYWDANDETSEATWQAGMPKWLRNTFSKVSSTMTAFNAMRAKAGKETLVLSWLDLRFGKGIAVKVHLNTDSSIAPETLNLIERARLLHAQGAFGEEALGIAIPSPESYARQKAEHTVVAKQETESHPAEEDLEGSDFEEESQTSFETCTVPAIEPFDIDFTVWEVTHIDGSTSEFTVEDGNAFLR